MLKGLIKPVGIVLGGILCIHLSASAAETDVKKAAPAKKAKANQKNKDAAPKEASGETKPKEDAPKAEAKESQPKEAAAPGKQENDPNKVLATVNGENVTQGEVDQIFSKYSNQIDPSQVPVITRQLLDGLINQKLVMQFVKNNKLEVSKEDVDAEVNKMREEIKSDPNNGGQTLEQVLESHGATVEDYKKSLGLDIAIERHLSKDLDDKKLKEYFEQNKAVFDGSEVKASHILVDTRQLKTDEERTQAKEKINKALAEIKGGKDFAEAAKQYSDCPSAKNGGDLGFFKRKGKMVEQFAAAAFALKEGQVSEPVKTNFGYHIIKATEIKKGNDVKFDDIKQAVKQDIMEDRGRNLISDIRKDAKIEIKTGS